MVLPGSTFYMNAEDSSLVSILLTKPVPHLEKKRDIWKIMSSKKLDTPCIQAFTLDLQDAILSFLPNVSISVLLQQNRRLSKSN